MHFNNTLELTLVYDDPQKESVCVRLQDNMWTNKFIDKIVKGFTNDNAQALVGSTIGDSCGGSYSDMVYITLSNYDIQHAASATSILGTTYAKAVTRTSLRPGVEVLSFDAVKSSANMITGGYPCLMSAGVHGNLTYRNMWVEGFSHLWDSEIFYIGKTYSASSFVNATVNSGSTNFDVYDASGFRKGQYICMYKAADTNLRQITDIVSNTIYIDTPTDTNFNKGFSVYADCALVYTAKSTLVNSAVSGATTLDVANIADFVDGQWGMIDNETNWQGIYISSVAVAGVSGTLTITGGLNADYSNTNSIVYGSFKSSHAVGTAFTPRDWYGWKHLYTTFSTAEGTAYGTTPIKTVCLQTLDNPMQGPMVSILLPYSIYKDSGSYLSTLYISYKYMVAARYLS